MYHAHIVQQKQSATHISELKLYHKGKNSWGSLLYNKLQRRNSASLVTSVQAQLELWWWNFFLFLFFGKYIITCWKTVCVHRHMSTYMCMLVCLITHIFHPPHPFLVPHFHTHNPGRKKNLMCIFIGLSIFYISFSSITGMSCSTSVFLFSVLPELSTWHHYSSWGNNNNHQTKNKAISFQHLYLIQEVPFT